MSLTRAELKLLGEKSNWQRARLTPRDVQRMGSDCLDWHRHFNSINLQKVLTAMDSKTPAVPSPASLASQAQRDLARNVLSRYPSYVFSDHNAAKMNAWLCAIQNPRFTEAEVVQAFTECAATGQLELRIPDGRIVVGRELMNLTAAQFQSLITPTLNAEERELKMSAAEYRAAHAEDFETEVPAVMRADRQQVMLTVLALPEFAGMALDHDDTTFLAREMKRQGLIYNVQNIAALIRANRDKFCFEPESAETHGQVVSTRVAS